MQEINQSDLTYYFKSRKIRPKNFNVFDRPSLFLREIRDREKTLEHTKNQREFKSDRNLIVRTVHESEEQKTAMKNIKMVYEARGSFVKFIKFI